MASPRLKPRSDIGQHHLGKVMTEAQPHDAPAKPSTPVVKTASAPGPAFGKKAATMPFSE
jgi:hypothetical protein